MWVWVWVWVWDWVWDWVWVWVGFALEFGPEALVSGEPRRTEDSWRRRLGERGEGAGAGRGAQPSRP